MNGYTQIEFDGKTIGIKFGLPARQWLMKILIDHPEFVESGDNGLNATYAAAILFTGYQNNCAIKLEKTVLDFSLFLSFVEGSVDNEEMKKQLDDALQTWTESVEIQKVIKIVGEDVIKKKSGAAKKLRATATDL